ncbi:P-loop containing nucleoside triphosphate hydrolase protein [Pisolithus croceorrhizus]|nr:P-loop containing nucleoside triphosphate hydrolase protein [Pisolithus croceorrhizus]
MSSNSLNIILFGETGVGKSSVINLIAGGSVAEVSPDADGCTMNSTDYQFMIGSRKITIWDTVGLEEPQMGVNGYYAAIVKAYGLIQKLSRAGGVDLLLFCIRGNRITATYTEQLPPFLLRFSVTSESRSLLVITHLEREHRMEDWWEPWFIRLLEHLASLVSGNSSSGKDVLRILTKRCGLDEETAQRLAAQLRYGDRQ